MCLVKSYCERPSGALLRKLFIAALSALKKSKREVKFL